MGLSGKKRKSLTPSANTPKSNSKTPKEKESPPWKQGRVFPTRYLNSPQTPKKRGKIALLGVLHSTPKHGRFWVVRAGQFDKEANKLLAPGNLLCNKEGMWTSKGTSALKVEVPDAQEGEQRLVNALMKPSIGNAYLLHEEGQVFSDRRAREHGRTQFYLDKASCKKLLGRIAVGMHYEEAWKDNEEITAWEPEIEEGALTGDHNWRGDDDDNDDDNNDGNGGDDEDRGEGSRQAKRSKKK